MSAARTVLSASVLLAQTLWPIAVRAEGPVPDLARGASLYSANCGRCHNARGPGEYSDLLWPVVVTHMRVIAMLPGDQAREIQAFLLATNNPPPRELPKPAPTGLSGAQLLQNYGCRGCHRIDGQGGAIGPSLEDLFERRDEDWVRAQIQTPRAHNPKTMMPSLGVTDAEVNAIVDALRAAD